MNEILDISFEDEGAEPIDLQTAKDWLRVDGTDEDAIITSLIKSSRLAIENYTSCSLVSKDVTCQARICDYFELPHGPVVGSAIVTDINGTAFTGFTVVDGLFKKVYGAKGLFTFVYAVGYDPVPEGLKLALLNELSYRYTNRGDQVKGVTMGSNYLCEAAVNLCQPYKRMAWL